jgi:hypothetical protein
VNYNKILVIAGNKHQFQDCCRVNRLNPKNVIYVTDKIHLRGVRGVVIRYGTYWENPIYKYYPMAYIDEIIERIEGE